MAEQNCPNCKKNAFTWHIDEDISKLTIWYCRKCGYNAFEDESTIRNCSVCGTNTESILEDDLKIYWWCSKCDKVTLIRNKENIPTNFKS